MADPTQQVITQTSIPDYAKPYVETMLGQAGSLLDPAYNPYVPYTGARYAQFSPLQLQSMQGAGQLQAAPQMQTASNIAAYAAQQGLGYGNYNPMQMQRESFATPGAAQQYMSPYMQNVVDVQQREARRQADIARQQQQAQAVAAGAFGGSRRNIQQAEANRALQTQLGGIQAQGLQNAYQQAQQQFNQEQAQRAQAMQLMEQSRQYGAGLGLQGLQAAMSGAGQLGQLGQGQFGQNLQALQLQNQMGQQQQQQAQNILNAQYQDWLNNQNWQYKNLGFFSDILRGLPMGQSAQTMYQAPPTPVQTITGLGLGAAGMSQLFRKEGGSVSSYADGGSVMSPEFKRYAVDHVDPRSLPQVQQNATARGDLDTVQAAMEQMARDAAIRRGIANALPPGADVVRAAGGGIIAFDRGGSANSDSGGGGDDDSGYVRTSSGLRVLPEDLDDDALAALGMTSEGVPDLYQRSLRQGLGYVSRIGQFAGRELTPEEEDAYMRRRFQLEQEMAGPNEAAQMLRGYLQESEAGRGDALKQAKAFALLKAAQAAVQPGGTVRGLAGAGAAFGESYSKALEADRAEKRALKMAQFNLLEAERKERLGFTKSAQDSLAAYRRNVQDANKNELLKLNYQAQGAGKIAQAAKPLRAAGAGPKPSTQAEGVAIYADDIRRENPSMPESKVKALALQKYNQDKAAGLLGVTTRVESATSTAAAERARKAKFLDPVWQEALKKKDADAMERREKELVDAEMSKGAKSGSGVIKLD